MSTNTGHRTGPIRLAGALAAAATLLGACSATPDPVVVPAPGQETDPPLVFDPEAEPSEAVLVLVPQDADALEVADLEQLRLQLGYGALDGTSDPAELAGFWRDAEAGGELLRTPLLRGPGAVYDDLGLTADDVQWEARFTGSAGEGYVMRFVEGVSMARVEDAAERGSGPLAGATVDADLRLATSGTASQPTGSWAAEDSLRGLVGETGATTYVARGCLPPGNVLDGTAPQALDDLSSYSVVLGEELATVRLGEVRDDVFDRARLGERAVEGFDAGFARPVGDPVGGRVGYTIADAGAATRLLGDLRLPFAVCAAEQQPS